MATSGNFLTSDSGQGDSNFYGRTIFEWSRYDWGRSGSQGFHRISYTLKTYGGSSSYYQYFFNGSMNVDGTGYTFPSPIKAYGAGATTLGSGSKTLYTDSNGNRSFGASAQGGIYTSSINTSGSGSWALNNIPMYGDITSVSPSSGLTDETSSIVVDWYKRAGTAHLWFRLDKINNSDGTHHKIGMSDPYTWTGWQTWLQQTMVNTNSTTLYIYYGDDLDSNGSVDRWDSPLTYTISILNDQGQANPTFSNFTYLDTNPDTVALTGNNQVLIQGRSTLQATIPVADKATPNKNANMSSYTFTIGGYSQSSTYSSSLDVVKEIGNIQDVTGTQDLAVRAIDSRGNSTTVTKPIEILPWSWPFFYGWLDIKYSNGFDASNGLIVDLFQGATIGAISPLTYNSVNLNNVTSLTWDISKGDYFSFTGTPTNIPFTLQSNGYINVDAATLQTDILAAMNTLGSDNTVKWYILFTVSDELESASYMVEVDIGRPILRIGTNEQLYYKEVNFFDAYTSSWSQYFHGVQAWFPTDPSSGTWVRQTVPSRPSGASAIVNTSNVLNNWCYFLVYLTPGSYTLTSYFEGSTNGGIIAAFPAGGFAGTVDTYRATAAEVVHNSVEFPIEEASTYVFAYEVVGASASGRNTMKLIAFDVRRTGFSL